MRSLIGLTIINSIHHFVPINELTSVALLMAFIMAVWQDWKEINQE